MDCAKWPYYCMSYTHQTNTVLLVNFRLYVLYLLLSMVVQFSEIYYIWIKMVFDKTLSSTLQKNFRKNLQNV